MDYLMIRTYRRYCGTLGALAVLLLSGCNSEEPEPPALSVDAAAEARRVAQQAADRAEREEAARQAQAMRDVSKAVKRIHDEGEQRRLALEDLKAQHERAQAGVRALMRDRQRTKVAKDQEAKELKRQTQELDRLLAEIDRKKSAGKAAR